MKQKIVVKVQINCQKGRTKALQIAAAANGVNSVAIEGKDRDQVVVIGDGVDPILLTNSLRKRVGRAELTMVQEVKSSDERKNTKVDFKEPFQWQSHCPSNPHVVFYERAYEPDPTSCTIM